MDRIGNRTFDEIRVGDTAQLTRTLAPGDIELFAIVSGDVNPIHVDAAFAHDGAFGGIVAHGMWGGALVSALLGTVLPGAGTIHVDQSLRFLRPVHPGDTISVVATVRETRIDDRRVVLDCTATNQHGEIVMSGTAGVIAPAEKVDRARIVLPDAGLRGPRHGYRQLLAMTHGMAPLRTAVVHPVEELSLAGAAEAARAGLIVPVLVGPEARIRDAAERAGIDIAAFAIVATEHSDAAALRAVAMARAGEVEALMKGALHTDELLRAVLDADNGLRTKRRISHVFAIDAPGHARPLFLTDAAINVAPTLEQKRDIVQNAIDLAHALGIAEPKVALLSAVETVSTAIRSTVDAAALCKMAERGQITGGILDGPLGFDNAVSIEAARAKGIVSQVAGAADILVVPDLEVGNMLAKQLEYLAGADIAGIALGARVPIILTSRSDRTLSRLGSCAIALLLARTSANASARQAAASG